MAKYCAKRPFLSIYEAKVMVTLSKIKSPLAPAIIRLRKALPIASVGAVILAIVLLSGCKKTPEKVSVLAQVGKSTLTLAELRESFPAELEPLIHREQYLDFIKRWIDDEVIYQQALKSNLSQDSSIARKLAKLQRKLLIEEFLSRENSSEVFEPDDMAMSQYYEMHKEDFRRKSSEIKYVHLRVASSKLAADLRNKISRGDFLVIAATNSLDPIPESYGSVLFKKQNELPPCLAQEINIVSVGSISQPINCPDGAYLVKVLEKQEVGSLISFTEAKEEINNILVLARKDKILEGHIAKYKDGLAIAYNIDQVPGITEDAKASSLTTPASTDPISKPMPTMPVENPTSKTNSAPTSSIRDPMPEAIENSAANDPSSLRKQIRPIREKGKKSATARDPAIPASGTIPKPSSSATSESLPAEPSPAIAPIAPAPSNENPTPSGNENSNEP